MAYVQGEAFSADTINALKTRVKNEMNRRVHNGSLAAFGTEQWDFTATSGSPLTKDQIRKIVEPLNQIANQNYSYETGQLATAISELDTRLTTYEQEGTADPPRGTSSCENSCSGLCVGCIGNCLGSCTGCKNTCTSNCGVCGGCTSCTGICTGCFKSCRGCAPCSGST